MRMATSYTTQPDTIVARFIRERQIALGISTRQLVIATGLGRTHVWFLRNGVRLPTFAETQKKLARVLEIDEQVFGDMVAMEVARRRAA